MGCGLRVATDCQCPTRSCGCPRTKRKGQKRLRSARQDQPIRRDLAAPESDNAWQSGCSPTKGDREAGSRQSRVAAIAAMTERKIYKTAYSKQKYMHTFNQLDHKPDPENDAAYS